MVRRLCLVAALVAGALAVSSSAFAGFGRPSWINDVQFGGSGIVGSNSQLVFTEVDLGNGQFVRLAMMAHHRYQGDALAAVAGSGAIDGIYYVQNGKYGGTGSDKDYAKWNFGVHISVPSQQQNTVAFGVKLLYDFNPAVGNTDDLGVGQGVLSLPFLFNSNRFTKIEDSWNLGMVFFSTGGSQNGLTLTAPSFPSFNPNVNGEYTFKLEVFLVTPITNNQGELVGYVWDPSPLDGIEMRVNVVPEPATLVGLVSLGASGLGAVVLRRRKKA